MSTSESHYINTANTRLHGAWMWHKFAEANSWTPLWSVLRDNILFFFTSEITSMENHIGTLQLGKDSKFSYGQSDPKDGYKFELLIGKKRKKFRVKTSYERELWRAYMEGIITGSVPAGILSPQDTAAINQKLRRVHQLVSPASSTSAAQLPRPSLSAAAAAPSHSASSPVLPVDRGDTTSMRTSSSFSSESPRRPSVPSVGSTGTGSSCGTELDPPNMVTFTVREPSQRSADSGRASDYFGGPVMRHKFADDKMPSWFFSDCSRELAEKILDSCHQQGNTLMRVSWTARDTGSYAISKRMARSGQVAHYEVIRVAEGYKINVENCNTAMKTLNQVMEFFIQLSGQAVTHPMTSNNLEKLGIDYTDYSRRIIIQEDNSAQADNDSDDGDNYEVPEESARKVASAPPPPPSFAPPLSAQHPSPLSFAPPPSVQPPPPPSFPPPPSAQPGAKVQHKTWGKVKTDETERQIQVGAALPKTLGPADRKQAKPDSAKPSVMQLNQTLQEQSVVENLDAVLRKEETRAVHRGSSSDIPPPLPAVPANRKKLTTDSQAVYVNAASQAAAVAESETDSHPRWNKRSQSVPAISNQGLDVQVPAHVVPPSIVKPSWAKTAPPTAPKTTRPLQKSVSQDIPHSSVASRIPSSKSSRRASLPLRRLRRLHQRWSSRQARVPAPLQPDYSSESNDSSADSDTQANPDPQEVDPFTEPRKMSIIELSGAIKTMDGRAVKGSETSEEDLDDQAKEPWEGEKKAVQKDLGTEETDCLSYCEIMIEPDVKGQLRAKRPTPTETRRPESMIYTEVITGPLWEGLKTPARQPTKTETSEEEPVEAESVHVKTDLKQKTITEKDEDGDVYYLQLLGEDEVIYDLMYASGQGSIQFWPPQSPPSDHDTSQDMLSLSEATPGVPVPNMIQELQQKLQMGTPQLKPTRVRVAGSAMPTALMSHQSQPADSGNTQEGEEYEDISQYYQNVSP